MKSFADCMQTYKEQIKKGDIQVAYSGLMSFIVSLRNHLKKTHPEFYVSGNFYQGNLDFTYFSFTPVSLKQRKLRVAIVFIHRTMEFKVWLGGNNKKIQSYYWEIISKKGFKKYSIPKSIEGIDFIVESVINADPNFDNFTELSNQLEKEIIEFANDMAIYISEL